MRTQANIANSAIKRQLQIYPGLPILKMDRKRSDVLFVLLILNAFLWIIPINSERIFGALGDIRNINYLLIFLILLPFFQGVYSRINKYAKKIWMLLLILFCLWFFIDYYAMRSRNIYFAVWMLITVGSIFYGAGDPKRLVAFIKIVTIIIGFSVLFGLLIVFVGEPFRTIRFELIKSDVGGVIYSKIPVNELGRLHGLSGSIFGFSYQLVVVTISSFVLFFYSRKTSEKILWAGILIMSFVGIMSNAERSGALGAFVGITMFLIAVKKSREYVLYAIILVVAIYGSYSFLHFQLPGSDKVMLPKRFEELYDRDQTIIRAAQPISGLITILNNPIYTTYDQYQEIGYHLIAEWGGRGGRVRAPHNHFINIGFKTGWLGIFIMLLIFYNIKKAAAIFRYKAAKVDDRFIFIYYAIVLSFIGNMINSCFHNTGLFYAEPGGMIFLAMIGAGASMKVSNKGSDEAVKSCKKQK